MIWWHDKALEGTISEYCTTSSNDGNHCHCLHVWFDWGHCGTIDSIDIHWQTNYCTIDNNNAGHNLTVSVSAQYTVNASGSCRVDIKWGHLLVRCSNWEARSGCHFAELCTVALCTGLLCYWCEEISGGSRKYLVLCGKKYCIKWAQGTHLRHKH